MRKFEQNPYAAPSVKECQSEVGEEVVNALIELEELVAVSPDVIFRKKDYDEMVEKVRVTIQQNGADHTGRSARSFGYKPQVCTGLAGTSGFHWHYRTRWRFQKVEKSMTFLKKLFTAPVFDDEVKTQQAYLLHIILWTLICVPIPFVIYALLLKPEDLSRTLLQAAFGETVNIILLFMLHRGYVKAASIIQVSAFWFFFTVTAFTGSGVQVKLTCWDMDW